MDEIKGVARARIRPGRLDDYKRLCAEAVEIVRTRDRGTTQYEIFFNEDESESVTFERYRDADAMLEHFAHIDHLLEPLLETATVTGELLGTPNKKLREQLEKFGERGPKHFTPWASQESDSTVALSRGSAGIPGSAAPRRD
jgi:quinol monooxygenase YgiN